VGLTGPPRGRRGLAARTVSEGLPRPALQSPRRLRARPPHAPGAVTQRGRTLNSTSTGAPPRASGPGRCVAGLLRGGPSCPPETLTSPLAGAIRADAAAGTRARDVGAGPAGPRRGPAAPAPLAPPARPFAPGPASTLSTPASLSHRRPRHEHTNLARSRTDWFGDLNRPNAEDLEERQRRETM
jgi:hypothetical protein